MRAPRAAALACQRGSCPAPGRWSAPPSIRSAGHVNGRLPLWCDPCHPCILQPCMHAIWHCTSVPRAYCLAMQLEGTCLLTQPTAAGEPIRLPASQGAKRLRARPAVLCFASQARAARRGSMRIFAAFACLVSQSQQQHTHACCGPDPLPEVACILLPTLTPGHACSQRAAERSATPHACT